ncbi:helix-turn-helix domain-containing protein [Marinilactibacillus kalidii]|uniref:helix-turn-helix domain-containing protein n=1 Tax=Marinilactibacillus kalidii TaxID=2820274 RepID=UPI001ABE7544|nr:Rgg/GadR/MutR family transcriptional regulator [Marinilactibacillus kalidii]
MNIGEIIKYIRLSKNINSKNVYSGILSRPAISKFEKGLSDTTSHKLFEILENLNISLEEFFFFYNLEKVKDDNDFLHNYFEAFYSNDVKKLSVLKSSNKEMFESSYKIKYLHYSALADLTLTYITHENVNEKSFKIIKSYLLDCEEWTYYELVLFTNSLDFFPEELILLLYKRARTKLTSFSQLRKYNNEVFTLILNILVFFIERNNIVKCDYFYNELLQNTSLNNNKMYERTMMIFFENLLFMMKTKKSNNEVEKIISIFNYLDMPVKAQQCSSLLESVKKTSSISND